VDLKVWQLNISLNLLLNEFVIDLEIDLQKVVTVLVTPSYINDQIEYC
jgi:hypothetical protein